MAATGRNVIFTPANIVAVLALAAVLVGSTVLVVRGISGPATASAGLRAVVHDASGVVRELPLDENAAIAVSTDAGSNTIEVRDGAVFMAAADCDGQDCVHQGQLTAPGKQIICLPHKLWVEVLAEGDAEGQMDVDSAAASDVDVLSR